MSFDPIQVRRELHQIPELAFQEFKTKELILSYLKTLPHISIIEFQKSTAILVEYTMAEGEYQLFRADMDALPVTEQTGCSFSSGHPGLMHACGHDVHCAILLGLIAEVTINNPKANLLFLFQPAEEGKGGAEAVLEEGIIQRYALSAAYALHVNPKLPIGYVSTKSGIFFAIPQEFDLTFIGKAAHAAFPNAGIDAMAAGIEFYNRVKNRVKDLSELQRLIFHIGRMESGVIRNIIADKCVLEGTHRTLSRSMRDTMNELITATAKSIANRLKMEYSVDFLCSYDPVVNDATLYADLVKSCVDIGVEFTESGIYMTGEDFGFFTTLYPGLLFWLGANDPLHELHSEHFLPDEACIPIGIKVLEAQIKRL